MLHDNVIFRAAAPRKPPPRKPKRQGRFPACHLRRNAPPRCDSYSGQCLKAVYATMNDSTSGPFGEAPSLQHANRFSPAHRRVIRVSPRPADRRKYLHRPPRNRLSGPSCDILALTSLAKRVANHRAGLSTENPPLALSTLNAPDATAKRCLLGKLPPGLCHGGFLQHPPNLSLRAKRAPRPDQPPPGPNDALAVCIPARPPTAHLRPAETLLLIALQISCGGAGVQNPRPRVPPGTTSAPIKASPATRQVCWQGIRNWLR